MKYHFIIFTLGLALGLFISHMYHTNYDDDSPIVINRESPRKLEAKLSKSETIYSKTFDSLKRQSIKLQIDLKDSRAALNTVKQKNYSLQVQVYKLLGKHIEKKQEKDFDSKYSCDSLTETVAELILLSIEKDSLYEKVTSNLEEQVANKDSTIGVKDKQYSEVKDAFTKTNDLLKDAIKENETLNKSFKKQKFKNKILSAALLIFTGAATNYLIQH